MIRSLSFTLAVFLFSSCHNDPGITGLEKKDAQELLKASACLYVVDDSIEYMPSYTRKSEGPISSPQEAWKELNKLYPDFRGRIKCWTEYNGYYVFSVGFNDPKTDCMFWHIVYVKKGVNEFRYFWPHT